MKVKLKYDFLQKVQIINSKKELVVTEQHAKTILIQNYHPAATKGLVRDFKLAGMRVVMPDSNWATPDYYFSNDDLGGELISEEEFMKLPQGFILICCREQQDNLSDLSIKHGDRVIIYVVNNNTRYKPYLGGVMISPDIQTLINYDCFKKFMYFPEPILNHFKKDTKSAFASRKINSYINRYNEFFPKSYDLALRFKELYKGEVSLYGDGSPQGELSHVDSNKNMSESFLTLHFKEKEGYGLSVLESMLLGTPVIVKRQFVQDKTLGIFFLDDDNSIIVDTVEEAIERIESLSYYDYEKMSRAAILKVREVTDTKKRINLLKKIL